MGKKSKRKKQPEALDMETASISYTDYNTIMSIQLLIATLNRIEQRQIDMEKQLSALRSEVDCTNAYLMVPGDMKDGNQGKSEDNEDPDQAEGGTGQDPSSGADE